MGVYPNRGSEKLIKETICNLWLLCLDSVGGSTYDSKMINEQM